MGNYSQSQKWEDVIPIPQDDGCANPLASIAYPEKYSEAMSYLRAVMAADEKSDRVLELIEDIIGMNPAHYTLWIYKADILFYMNKDLHQELLWLNTIAIQHAKNFQIWHHRQVVMSHIGALPDNELSFLTTIFNQDAKNYHVWSYRQWLVRHFSLWDVEIPYVEMLINQDVRNNSAWNHRWFIIFGRHVDPKKDSMKNESTESKVSPDIIGREIEYAKTKIIWAPQNQSPWLYLRGVVRQQGKGLVFLKYFAEQFADLSMEDDVRSTHALDLLADAYAEEQETEKSARALDLLANRYDPIRKNYWEYRKSQIPRPVES